VTSEDIIVLTPAAPLTDVYENFKDWNDSTPGARCSKDGKLFMRVPIPTDWTYPHEGAVPDAAAAIMLQDGRSLYQTQPFHRCAAGGHTTSHYDYPTVDIYGDGIEGAHGGSGLSSIGGTIRVGELKPGGEIRHALKIISGPTRTWRTTTMAPVVTAGLPSRPMVPQPACTAARTQRLKWARC
jgi:hypothetical protein